MGKYKEGEGEALGKGVEGYGKGKKWKRELKGMGRGGTKRREKDARGKGEERWESTWEERLVRERKGRRGVMGEAQGKGVKGYGKIRDEGRGEGMKGRGGEE